MWLSHAGRSALPPRRPVSTIERRPSLLQGAHTWPDEHTCRREVFRWVTRYNTRHHSYCGQQAPIVYERYTRYAAVRRLIDHPVSIIRG